MNHQLSIFEFILTVALVLIAVTLSYQWLASELVVLIETSFNTIPH